MSENIKVRWLVDNEQTKIAPKTFSSQILNEDGTHFKDTVEASITEIDEKIVAHSNNSDIHVTAEEKEGYATKEYVENLYTKLNSNTVLGFYCIEDVTIITNGISKVYPANSNVEVTFIEDDVFEIIPTSDSSILSLTAFPGALGTFYTWLEGVALFSNILFDMNDEAMYSKWSQGNQGTYHVQSAQYTNCIFWSDNPYISDVSKRTNYTLTHTSQLPLCYSTIPDNTFKSFYLAGGVNSDPNWSNQAYKDSFAKANWATQVFSYYGARTVGLPGMFDIVLPKDCRGLMFDARNIENAGTFDAINTTNFGAKSGSWREAFGDCTSLRRLYIKNLKVSLNISWSPIDYNSISYIVEKSANTNAITISVSPYTYNLLSQSDFDLATSKNITIELLTGNYVEDRRLSAIADKADKSYVDNQIANLVNSAPETLDTLGELATAFNENKEVVDALNEGIVNKQNKLSGSQGQVVGFDADGNAIAQDNPQSDWNQNDESAPDYVKNRTHWEEEVVVSTYDSSTSTMTLTQYDESRSYAVEFNGIVYDNLHFEKAIHNAGGNLYHVYLGEIVTKLSDETAKYPFSIYAYSSSGYPDISQDIELSVSVSEGINIDSVTIYDAEKIVHHLDPKYIKDMYYEEDSDVDIVGTEISLTTAINGNGSVEILHNTDIPFELGQVWSCKGVSGNAYELTVQEADDGTLYIGTYPDVNEIPFYVTSNTIKANGHWVDMSDNYTLYMTGISNRVVVHKIDQKYLPEVAIAQSDWNASEGETGYIKNRTHYTETVNETIYETLEFTATSESQLVKTLIGGEMAAAFNNRGSITKIKINENSYNASLTFDRGTFTVMGDVISGNGYYSGGRDFTITSKDTSVLSFVIGQTYSVSYASDEESVSYHQLDANYIPIGIDFAIEDNVIRSNVGRKYGSSASIMSGEIFNNIAANVASSTYSHAEGNSTTASGIASHAEGSSTTASGRNSHTEGSGTTASGEDSHAEGSGTTASGLSSHAEGFGTIAASGLQHVQGKYNIEDTDSIYLNIVGNGAKRDERSNAYTLDWNGNAWFSGDVYVGSTSGTNKDEGSKKLVTQEYVDIRVPAWTEADEGKVLKIINGIPTWASISVTSTDDDDGNVVIS